MFWIFFSRREDTGLQDVMDNIEEVVLVAQGLQGVSTKIKELIDLANSNRRTVSLTDIQVAAIRGAFACVICRGLCHFIPKGFFQMHHIMYSLSRKGKDNCWQFSDMKTKPIWLQYYFCRFVKIFFKFADPMNEPMVSSCCHSLIGCRSCIEQWQLSSPSSPKCRAGDSTNNMQLLTGLSDVLAALRDTILE